MQGFESNTWFLRIDRHPFFINLSIYMAISQNFLHIFAAKRGGLVAAAAVLVGVVVVVPSSGFLLAIPLSGSSSSKPMTKRRREENSIKLPFPEVANDLSQTEAIIMDGSRAERMKKKCDGVMVVAQYIFVSTPTTRPCVIQD